METMVLWGIASCCTCTQAQKVGQETRLLVGWAGDLHATLTSSLDFPQRYVKWDAKSHDPTVISMMVALSRCCKVAANAYHKAVAKSLY